MDTRPQPLQLDDTFTYQDEMGQRRLVFPITDFWRWAFSNVQENVIRGILAEYIVARALDIPILTRQSWDEADLVTRAGVKIEVKSSAFIQAWDQGGAHSRIEFSNLKTKLWTPDAGEAETPDYHSDVYVFCIQTAESREDYAPLDLDQWEFRVLSKAQVASNNTRTLSHTRLKKLAPRAVRYAQLAAEIQRASTNASTA